MQSGLHPLKHDHRDFDFIKSKRFGAVTPSFSESYTVDAGLWTPNQDKGSTLFNPNVPPMPYGCTNYSQTDLCVDEDKTLYNPSYIESITHANERGGTDLRTSLNAVVKNGMEDVAGNIIKGQHQAYFNIQAQGNIDWFDAVRLAMVSTSSEKRGVSVGTPWFPEFSPVGGMLGIPIDWSLHRATWHNYCIKGWKTINGVTYLTIKPWLGIEYGDKGFGYVSRELFNTLMSFNGSAAFTIDKLMVGEAIPVESSVIEWIVSLVRNLFHV